MAKQYKSKKLNFIKSMEINGISPLPHYYEEIYANNTGIKKLGLRGDRNYLFYSIDGFGTGYYEANEMELSSISVEKHFRTKANREKFLKSIRNVLDEVHLMQQRLDGISFEKLDTKQIAKLFLEANQLHGKIFSHYIVSQPYRISKLEEKVATELRKRVATNRVNHYMTLLATSEKPTKITNEELDWLRLLIKYKDRYQDLSINVRKLEKNHPDFYKDLQVHFETYKSLTLGDGNWEYDIKYYIDALTHDFKKPLSSLKQLYKRKLQAPAHAKATREQLITELRLNQETVEDLKFLAEIGHTRLQMRIDGWLPFVKYIIMLDIQLSTRLKLPKDNPQLLNYMSEAELTELARTGKMIDVEEVKQRISDKSEFLIMNKNGKYEIIFGEEAGKTFNKLVPKIDHSKTTEISGATAVTGHIKDTVCVYRWGDDLSEKMKVIKKHPILVTGQTRPSMMSIIRLARGIITDEGGITSHAAIVSRELGIPSVIGTRHATNVFNDGDIVELDANNGIVRRVEK